MRNRAIASLLVVVILVSLGAGYFFGTTSQRTNLVSITTVGDETYVTWHTALNTCASCTSHGGGATFTFPLSVNYSGGPWSLHYWVQNFTGTQNSISGNLNGKGIPRYGLHSMWRDMLNTRFARVRQSCRTTLSSNMTFH